MSVTHRVLWSPSAEKDLIAIIEFIAADSPADAARVFEHLRKKAFGLYRFPERGRVVPELREQGIVSYRELIIAPWRIIYRVSGHDVFVLAVLDSRRNIEDLLLQRLTSSNI